MERQELAALCVLQNTSVGFLRLLLVKHLLKTLFILVVLLAETLLDALCNSFEAKCSLAGFMDKTIFQKKKKTKTETKEILY